MDTLDRWSDRGEGGLKAKKKAATRFGRCRLIVSFKVYSTDAHRGLSAQREKQNVA
jgi:hypothetical protein